MGQVSVLTLLGNLCMYKIRGCNCSLPGGGTISCNIYSFWAIMIKALYLQYLCEKSPSHPGPICSIPKREDQH